MRARSRVGGTLRLAAVFLLLVGINVYVFFFRDNTSIKSAMRAGSIHGKKLAKAAEAKGEAKGAAKGGVSEKAAAAAADTPAVDDGSLVVRGRMKGHNGLFAALAATKLDSKEVAAVVKALRGKLDMRALKPHHTFESRLDPATHKLRRFSYRVSKLLSVVVERRADGTLVGRRLEQKLDTRLMRVAGRISGSLTASLAKIGVSGAVAARLLHLFGWDIDWYHDPRPGDVFKVVIERQFLKGKPFGYGRILAAEYSGKVAGRHRAFYYKPRGKNAKGDYYNERARLIRRQFIKTPLYHYRRISSRFHHRRFHPVLKRRKRHNGVDFAAPPGTPVVAAADGVVLSAARAGGAGRAVLLQHKGKIVTQYFHLLRFARGIRAGRKVRQRQVIGYVGSTGLATGPHLHYGMKIRGRYVNPLRMHIPQGRMLPLPERARFRRVAHKLARELSGITVASR
ncbi:MAG: peptidoglycan DD-metalloendopeptidase family protein [Myxococcales bacterium]|nr:peptidoglycan DD-metalloendopeptidase family protein [Myxococcales bacterium]